MQPEKRCQTRGITTTIPPWQAHLLWLLRDSMEVPKRDYLQVFRLSRAPDHLHIEHRQEQPPYRKSLRIPCTDAVNAKIYIIDDQTHVTMLLADEY